MPIEIKQMSIRSHVSTKDETSTKKEKHHCCDGEDKSAAALSDVSAQHTTQFQAMKWLHRKLQQDGRER